MDIESMIEDCENVLEIKKSDGGPGFNAREQEFLGSIREQWDERQKLSEKQEDWLRDLWDRI